MDGNCQEASTCNGHSGLGWFASKACSDAFCTWYENSYTCLAEVFDSHCSFHDLDQTVCNLENQCIFTENGCFNITDISCTDLSETSQPHCEKKKDCFYSKSNECEDKTDCSLYNYQQTACNNEQQCTYLNYQCLHISTLNCENLDNTNKILCEKKIDCVYLSSGECVGWSTINSCDDLDGVEDECDSNGSCIYIHNNCKNSNDIICIDYNEHKEFCMLNTSCGYSNTNNQCKLYSEIISCSELSNTNEGHCERKADCLYDATNNCINKSAPCSFFDSSLCEDIEVSNKCMYVDNGCRDKSCNFFSSNENDCINNGKVSCDIFYSSQNLICKKKVSTGTCSDFGKSICRDEEKCTWESSTTGCRDTKRSENSSVI
jgi:hypothetical protein